MSLRFQRLIIIILSLIFIASSAYLILINAKKNLVFFYTPSELINSQTVINEKVRIGGFIKKDSLKNIIDSNGYSFIITDNQNDILIEYKGILPDLFREEQGVVIEGMLLKNYTIQATKVFAKHDENYMPVSIKKQLENNKYWRKKYK